MGYRYLDDFRRGISVFAIFSYGIAVLGTPQCPPLYIVLMHIEKFERQLFEESTSQFYVQRRSFFVSYCDKNENYCKSVTSRTWEIHI